MYLEEKVSCILLGALEQARWKSEYRYLCITPLTLYLSEFGFGNINWPFE